MHVIDPDRFPFDDGPGYKPLPHESGTAHALATVLDRFAVGHALLVQPSCYGFDNSAMLHAMQMNAGRFKAIAMLAPDATDQALSALAEAGVVGVRFNLLSYDPDALAGPQTAQLLQRINDMKWFVEVVATESQWPYIAPTLRRNGVNVLIDHFGMPDVSRPLDQGGFQAVLQLGREDRAVVKLTTPYALHIARADHPRAEPFVAALIEAFGAERCIWGSDWPFLAVSGPPDYGEALAFVDCWFADPADRRKVLAENAARLFGFDCPDLA